MNDAEHGEGPSYSYRPSALGAPWTFRLTADGIHWDSGRRNGVVRYDTIRRVRLSYRPAGMQSQRFMTEIWSSAAPKLTLVSSSWKSMVEQIRLDRDYGIFIGELHHRVAVSGGRVTFDAGLPFLMFWGGVILFAAAALGLAALTVRAVHERAFAAAGLIGAFFALFLWQAGGYFARNRPGRYEPRSLPRALMPPAN
jgi:hypothetical protein